MRLPRLNGEIDIETVKKQVAIAMKHGVNYFDTAYFYHGGESENCAGKVLSQYPRSSYMLADKMPVSRARSAADVERIFNEQLKKCKVDYFDFYLLHALNAGTWKKAQRLKVYEFLKKKKDEGKIRHLGFSFHDTPDVLKKIAEAYPWDFAQIQLNYLDWTIYRSREQYEILTRLGIPVIVMEPLRGGALATLNQSAREVFTRSNPDVSVASWAFRYVGSLPNVLCVLSGMTMTEHLMDNIKTFTNFKPLSPAEQNVITSALNAYQKTGIILCTACQYCMPCPVGVNIPANFNIYNTLKINGNQQRFNRSYANLGKKQQAASCVSCGLCKKKCPQQIDIPAMLKKVAAAKN
ncbi:MAG: aldo/keto reductase [Lentisphaeria bacterium]|nr:aldo/keto reductase [Lentisphaeria bacterium]